MLKLLFLAIAFTSTAAWYDPYDYNDGFERRMDRFWNNFDQQMSNLGKRIENVVKNAKSRQPKSRIDGNEYKKTIHLSGFNQEDIVVTAQRGSLVVQAIHNVVGEPVNNYLYVTSLPEFVDERGSWSYYNGILTIAFPIIKLESEDTTESPPSYVNNENELSENNNHEDNLIEGNLDKNYKTGYLPTYHPSQDNDDDSAQTAESDVENI